MPRQRSAPGFVHAFAAARSSPLVTSTGDKEFGQGDDLRLTLSYRPPLAWEALLAFLGARATPGVEHVSAGGYSRTVRLEGRSGIIRIRRPENGGSPALRSILHLEAEGPLAPCLMALCARVRHLFDLIAEPNAIESHLMRTGFPPLHRSLRGLRVPGAFDGFELAVRAILGQQVSVKGATTLMSRLAAAFGEPMTTADPHLTRLTPTAERIAGARLERIRAIAIPAAREL